MTDPLRLRIHVSEPFDFERENEASDLFGSTVDHNGDADEWEVELESTFHFNEMEYDRVLIGPRYVGEHLSKVHDAMLGTPVRIAHRTPSDDQDEEWDGEGWHFAMTGTISLAPPPPPENTDNGPDPSAPDETTGI